MQRLSAAQDLFRSSKVLCIQHCVRVCDGFMSLSLSLPLFIQFLGHGDTLGYVKGTYLQMVFYFIQPSQAQEKPGK